MPSDALEPPTLNSLAATTVAAPRESSPRLEELDALRGLAALIVFVYHCIFILSSPPSWLNTLVHSPITLVIYGGHQAVILFFVLSGFVLYLPYTRPGYSIPYKAFITKRICRIYLPYLCAVVFMAAAYLIFFSPARPAGLSDLYGWTVLTRRQLISLFINHIFFIGWFHRELWNGATWTLAEEMRISLLFPVIAALVLRLKPATAILVAISGSALVSLGIHLVHHRSPLETIHYACLFILGAVLASNRELLVSIWRSMSTGAQVAVASTSFVICGYAVMLLQRFPALITEEASDWLIAITASVFLISSIANTRFSSFLRCRPMQNAGRTSYGIYLLHLPILFIMINLLWTRVPHLVVDGIALIFNSARCQSVLFLY